MSWCKYFLVVLFLLEGMWCNAQVVNKLGFGINGGLTFPKLITSPRSDNLRTDLSSSYGLTISYRPQELRSIQTGISFARCGTYFTYQLNDTNGSPQGETQTHIQLNYIDIPMVFRFESGSRLRGFMGVGGYLGILHKSQYLDQRQGVTDVIRSTDDQFQGIDAGFIGELGASQTFGGHWEVSVSARLRRGFYNISTADPNLYSKYYTFTPLALIQLVYTIQSSEWEKSRSVTI